MRERNRRGGIVRGCLAVIALLFTGILLLAVFSPRKPTNEPAPVSPVVTQQPSTSPDPLKPGTIVELTTLTLADSLPVYEEYLSKGLKPPGYQPGKELFGVMVGASVRYEETRGRAARVTVLGKSWHNRSGWLARSDIRTLPTDEESALDVVDRLDLKKRREIYRELCRADLIAGYLAEERHPLGVVDADPGRYKATLARHQSSYKQLVKEGRVLLVKKHKVDGATLDRIDKEGSEKKWPMGEDPKGETKLVE